MHQLTPEELLLLRKGTVVYQYPVDGEPQPVFDMKSGQAFIEYQVVHISIGARTTFTFVARGSKAILQLQTTRESAQLLDGSWWKDETAIMRKIRTTDLPNLAGNVICHFPNDGSPEAAQFDDADFPRQSAYTVVDIQENDLHIHIDDILSSMDKQSTAAAEVHIQTSDVTNGFWWTSLP